MANELGTAYVTILPRFGSGFSSSIEKKVGGSGRKAGESFNLGFGNAIKGIAATVGVTEAVKGITGIFSESISGYADTQQLVGGVETLYGDMADTVIQNAQRAYETAGLSANEYMETSTSFAAALVNSLGDNAWQAANYADMAITDMADNANKMGTDMESIQNAYQGFAKQNFTMLDNLKLGRQCHTIAQYKSRENGETLRRAA